MSTIAKLAFSVHPIDINTSQISRDVVRDDADLDSFVGELVESVKNHEEKRRFIWANNTTEVRAQLGLLMEDVRHFDTACEVIAKRLHLKEKAAQKEHGHITDLQRGTLFQLVFQNGVGRAVLLAKVFNSKFLDEKYKKHEHGLPFERKILKTCLEFDADGDLKGVSVSDSNATIARFWWSEFLELEEQTTDEYNTNTAFAAVESVLGRRLKQNFKSDYYQFRNHLITFFNTRTRYSHKDLVANVFGAYQPLDKTLDIQSLRQEVEKLPEKKEFDSTFTIVPDIVKKRRRTRIALTDQIDLEIKDSLDRDAIRAANLKDGTKGVFIRTESGFESFRVEQTAPVPNLPTKITVQKLSSKRTQTQNLSN